MFPTVLQVSTRLLLAETAARHGRRATLDDIDDEDVQQIAARGFDWVWLMGVWQTGEASRQISLSQPELRAGYADVLPDFVDADVCGSPFAVKQYVVHRDFGGDAALARLRDRMHRCGLKLMLDFVPNHTALDHAWAYEHPEYFVVGSEAEARRDPTSFIHIAGPGGVQVFAHGRDPYFPSWTDTLQLNIRHARCRAAMIESLGQIADRCDGLRCDMAMLLLPHVFRKTWGELSTPRDGTPPVDTPFWPEAIAKLRTSHADFLLLALRKRSAEELKLVEAKRLLEKLQAEARQMQSAKALDRKEALIKLNDLGRQLDERRESIDTAAAIRKQLSKLRSKQSPAADKLNQALSRGDYRAAAEQLQRLQKELDAASSTDEQRTAAAKQLDDLQRQLDEIAQKSEARRDEAQRQSDAASIPGTGGEPSETSAAEAETASKQLAALSSQGEQLRRLQTSAEQGAEAMRSGNAAQAKSALEDLQRQLDGLTAQSEELTLLDEGLRDVAATKAGLAQGSGGADATSPGAGESPGGPTSDEGPSGGEPSKAAKTGGLQPGIGTSDRVHSTDDAATDTAAANLVDARVRTEPGVGELNVVGPADGPNAKGRALEAIREQAATLSNAAAQQPVVNPSLDRSRRAQKRQYFDALREAP